LDLTLFSKTVMRPTKRVFSSVPNLPIHCSLFIV
jgi:hypothetical protein